MTQNAFTNVYNENPAIAEFAINAGVSIGWFAPTIGDDFDPNYTCPGFIPLDKAREVATRILRRHNDREGDVFHGSPGSHYTRQYPGGRDRQPIAEYADGTQIFDAAAVADFDRVRKLAKEVADAWLIEGRVPSYHREQRKRLFREWRTLANAIAELAELIGSEQK